MLLSVLRLRGVLTMLNTIRQKTESCEPITVIAHSQGTILTLAALDAGATIDNFIMMGSPLDVLPFQEADNDLLRSRFRIRAKTYNYWSRHDEWAAIKGGIGAHGDALSQVLALRWIIQREFAPGVRIRDYLLPSDGDFKEYDHSDYMTNVEFFTRVHGPDVAPTVDIQMSMSPQIHNVRRVAVSW